MLTHSSSACLVVSNWLIVKAAEPSTANVPCLLYPHFLVACGFIEPVNDFVKTAACSCAVMSKRAIYGEVKMKD